MKLKWLVLLFVLPFCCFSQTKIDSLLIGSWKFTGYEMQKTVHPASATAEQISFFPDHMYQQRFARSTDSVQTIYAGNWEISDDQTSIGFVNRHLIPHPENVRMKDDWYEISSISDSVLLLGGYEGNIRIYKTYRRIEKQNRLSDNYTAPPEVAEHPVYRKAYLVNSAHPKKKIKLQTKNDDIHFKYTLVPNDTSEYKTIITCSGDVKDINDSVIFINTNYLNSVRNLPGDSSLTLAVNYRDSIIVTAIPIQNITEVSFMKNSKAGINSIGVWLASLSISSILVIAPASGIQFHPLRYNLRRYAIVSLYSLAGLTGGLILTSISNYNYYTIIHQSSEANKFNWYLQPGN